MIYAKSVAKLVAWLIDEADAAASLPADRLHIWPIERTRIA
jgi:hypothetical protein